MKIKIQLCSNFSKVKPFLYLEMSAGKLGEDYDTDLSFKMNVSQFRRKKLLDSIMSKDQDKKQRGNCILKNFKKQIITNPQTK